MTETCGILSMHTEICTNLSNQDLPPSQNTYLLKKKVWYWIVTAQLVMSKPKAYHWQIHCEWI